MSRATPRGPEESDEALEIDRPGTEGPRIGVEIEVRAVITP